MEQHQFQMLLDEAKKQTRLLNRIKNNVVFWFWLTIVGVPLGAAISLLMTVFGLAIFS